MFIAAVRLKIQINEIRDVRTRSSSRVKGKNGNGKKATEKRATENWATGNWVIKRASSRFSLIVSPMDFVGVPWISIFSHMDCANCIDFVDFDL